MQQKHDRQLTIFCRTFHPKFSKWWTIDIIIQYFTVKFDKHQIQYDSHKKDTFVLSILECSTTFTYCSFPSSLANFQTKRLTANLAHTFPIQCQYVCLRVGSPPWYATVAIGGMFPWETLYVVTIRLWCQKSVDEPARDDVRAAIVLRYTLGVCRCRWFTITVLGAVLL